MYRKITGAFHLLNIVFQSLYSLALPIGIGVLASYLLTSYLSAPGWVWAVFIVIGTLSGLYSMVKYILSAISNIERMERQREIEMLERIEKEEKQKELRALAKDKIQDKNGDGE